MSKLKQSWRTRLLPAFVLIALLISFVLFQQAFGADGLLNARLLNSPSLLKWLVLWGIKLGLVITTDMLVLVLFVQLGHSGGHLRHLFHGWSLWIILGFTLTSYLSTQVGSVGMPQLISALFPVVRNSFSFLTGAILFGMLAPYITVTRHERNWWLAMILILALPMFGQDIWAVGNGFGLSAAILFGIVASLPVHQSKRNAIFHAILLAGIGFLSIPVLAAFSHWGTPENLSAAGQMVGLLSVFTLIPARLLLNALQIDKPIEATSFQNVFCVAGFGLILVTAASPYKLLIPMIQNIVVGAISRSHGLWLIVSTLTLVVLALIVSFALSMFFLHSKMWQLGNKIFGDMQVTDFLKLPPREVRSRLRQYWHYVWPTCLAFTTFYTIQLISTLVSYPTLKQNGLHQILASIIPTLIFKRFSSMVLGAILLMCLFWIVRGLTTSFWLAYGSVTTLALAWCVANAIKVGPEARPFYRRIYTKSLPPETYWAWFRHSCCFLQ
ncbi:hypothetical protein [Lacticaseibacillus salsurivasis]|uniref:hypothetical protein n=1 Tax=Lacticaseibacillus salsurivasis TaxID=3081441 RepID=UPI0030C6B6C1